MSTTTPSNPVRARRPARAWVAAGALFVMLATLVTYVAAPNNDWYLPGQTVSMRSSVENHVNGHIVIVGVTQDGSALISIDRPRYARVVGIGEHTRLAWPFTLTVVETKGRAPNESESVGGTGLVVVRVGLG